MGRIFLSAPHMSGLEQQYIQEAFSTNWIAPLGPNVDAFERAMCDYTGCKAALALSAGTAAIHLALKLLNVGQGDRVFCSTLTFSASANPIVYQGAEPVFLDSDEDSWNMSPTVLQRALREAAAIGRLPKAVIVVDLYGQSADYDAILALCNEYDVPVVEDAAEALGASYKGKACGTLGKFGIFSFNGNKIITTSGGGMLISDDQAAIEKARFWATQAREPAKHYQHKEIGYNYRLSNVLAGIGRGQLQKLNQRVQEKHTIFERYEAALADLSGVSFMPEADYGKSTRWLTVMRLDPKCSPVAPAQVMDTLAAADIESRPVWKPMHLQPVFSQAQYYAHEEGSVADQLFAQGVCLPSGTGMTANEQTYVIEKIKSLW